MKLFKLGIPEYMTGTKWTIFEKALEMFAQQGIEAVSMRDIANAVGIKVSSIYNHFSSKEEIVKELYHYCEIQFIPIDDYIEKLDDYDDDDSPFDIMSKFILWLEPEDNFNINRIYHIAMGRMRTDERARRLIEKQFQRNFVIIKKILYNLKEKGKIKEIDVDNFITIYQHLCFSASYHIDTFMSIPFPKWVEINQLLFSLILKETQPHEKNDAE